MKDGDKINELCDDVFEAQGEIARLREAIIKHRDQRGDDRCWLDDQELYAVIDPSVKVDQSLPPKCDFLKSCERFWEQRQRLDEVFALKHPTIGQLEREIARLRALVAVKDEALRQFANKANWIHPAPDEWHWGFKRDFAPETIAKAALEKE